MKIAVASNGDNSISPHFGRSAVWVVFDIEDGSVSGAEVRPNRQSHHATEACHGHNGGPHSHAVLIAVLTDCEAVIAGGMGWRAAEDLKKHGIEPYITEHHRTPQEAAELFAAGTLAKFEQSFCRGHHHG